MKSRSTNYHLSLFDIDNTLYPGHVLTDFPKYLLEKGIVSESVVKLQGDDYEEYLEGHMGYELLAKRWLERLSQGLTGLELSLIDHHLNGFFNNGQVDYFFNITRELKARDYDIYLVSAEPQFVGQSLVKKFQLAGELSTVFEVENGLFTGKISRFLSNGRAKNEAVSDLLKKYPYHGSLAFGDSIVDVEMLQLVETAVCINPSKELKEIAGDRKWKCIKRSELLNVISSVVGSTSLPSTSSSLA